MAGNSFYNGGEKMLYELQDTAKVEKLFQNWEGTMILSCLQKVMGRIIVTNPETPQSACAIVGCFHFYAGKPDPELILHRTGDFVIMVPQNEAWAEEIEKKLPKARRVIRYAMKHEGGFDRNKLRTWVDEIPDGYILRPIDRALYDECLQNRAMADLVAAFDGKEAYLRYGRGMVILKGTQIVSGASSYSRYREGIEIEVDTIEGERRRHLARSASAALILQCLEEGLYPSWDAQNLASVSLARQLGYELSYEYPAYECV